jgi:deoxycytidylate deaminase
MKAMDLALECARQSKHPNWKLGAVLVVRNQIVDSTSNLKSVPFTNGICAETRLLKRSPRIARKGAVVYVARIRRLDGAMAMAKPCIKCDTYLRNLGIKDVWYTDEDGWHRYCLD